ncbi:MAG: hypothetical protein UT84_C0007G0020, partial [Candidatus Curtissbacteria bacterium GW2011_GWA1_40_16]
MSQQSKKQFKLTNSKSSANPETLLPTDKIIALAKSAGVDFGPGNPAERIRYFIKLGILPHAQRRSYLDPASNLPTAPIGHLPYSSVKKLIEVDRLYKTGKTYPQIAQKLNEEEKQALAAKEQQTKTKGIKNSQQAPQALPAIHFFPKIGLNKKDVENTLAQNQKKIEKIVEKKLAEQAEITQAVSSYVSGNIAPTKISRLSYTIRGMVTITVITGLVSAAIFAGTKLSQKAKEAGDISRQLGASNQNLGTVLAASSANHKFYIDADTEISGSTTFIGPITAPNVIYGLTGGTGVTVTAGQRPTVSIDTSTVVSSLNSTTGDLTVKGSGGTSVSTSGSTITISSTSGLTSEADTLSTVTGRGATTSTALTLSGGISVDSSSTFSSDTDFTLAGTENVTIANTSYSTATYGLFDVDATSTTASTRALEVNFTYSNTTAASVGYGTYSTIAHTNSTNANTLYGTYLTLTDSVALGNTDIGQRIVVTNDGASSATKNVYGSYISATGTNATGSNDQFVYGIYASATGDAGGIQTVYGIYATASTGDTTYAGYFSGDVKIANTGNLILATNTADTVLYNDGTKVALSSVPSTGGQCLLSVIGGPPGWGNCASGASSPFQSIGGVIDKFALTDEVDLTYGSAGDVQLEIKDTSSITPTADALQINLNNTTAGIIQNVDGIQVSIRGGDGTGNTVAAERLSLSTGTPAPTGDETFLALDIDGITGTSASEYAIRIGTNWDRDLSFTDTTPTITIGNTGTLTISDGTNTLLTLADNSNAGDLGITGDLTVSGGDIVLGTTSIFSGGDTASLNNIDAI